MNMKDNFICFAAGAGAVGTGFAVSLATESDFLVSASTGAAVVAFWHLAKSITDIDIKAVPFMLGVTTALGAYIALENDTDTGLNTQDENAEHVTVVPTNNERDVPYTMEEINGVQTPVIAIG